MGVGMVLKVGRLRASSMSHRRRRTEMLKASNRDAEGVDGFSPSLTRGSGGDFLEICV